MSTLNVRIFESPDAVVIRLEGDAGLRAADGLQTPFERIKEARPARVVCDLAGLRFAASLFLGLLVDLRKGIVYQGGQLQLAAVQPNIRELLHVTGLEDLFEFIAEAPTEQASAAAIA